MYIFSFKCEVKHAPAVLVTYVFWNWVAKIPLRTLFLQNQAKRGKEEAESMP